MELWKDIAWTDGQYQVSDRGRIRSQIRLKDGTTKETILKAHKDKKGYDRIKITAHRESRTVKVHREVAIAFVDNPTKLPQVNHKNGNKSDNNAGNLEWCTNAENAQHAIDNGLWSVQIEKFKQRNEQKRTPIVATDLATGESFFFASMSDAQRAIGTKHINAVLRGERSQANGYAFRRG